MGPELLVTIHREMSTGKIGLKVSLNAQASAEGERKVNVGFGGLHRGTVSSGIHGGSD